jgi:hypothetical protein
MQSRHALCAVRSVSATVSSVFRVVDFPGSHAELIVCDPSEALPDAHATQVSSPAFTAMYPASQATQFKSFPMTEVTGEPVAAVD